MMLRRHSYYALAAIIALFIAVALLYARAVPIFEQSDEAEHMLYIHTILEQGDLPVIQSLDEMMQQDDPVRRWNNQAHHAPLYYLLGATLVSWSARDDITDYLTPNPLIFLRDVTENNANKWLHPLAPGGDTAAAVNALRLLNIVIGSATLGLVFLTARQCLPASWSLLAAAFTACLPTFLVVHSGVTNDALTIFLYTAGILWSVRVWQAKYISPRDTALIGIILAGIALTKLTGLSLVGVVLGVLLVGAWQRIWSWRIVAQVMGVALGMIVLLAGWWYVRNIWLYGDPFALAATSSIWGRTEPLTLAIFSSDISRIARSFWFMVGYLHEPVFAPMSFYIYCGILTILGSGGVVVAGIRAKTVQQRLLLVGLAGICLLVIALLLYGTRRVDISYGRLLLPAISAFAVLMVIGWRQLLRFIAPVLLLPLLATAISAPLQLIPQAYPRLQIVDSAPADSVEIGVRTIERGNLTFAALRRHDERLHPGDTLSFDLYIRGSHPDNPALLVTAADSLRAVRLGHIEIFPGMTATNALPADTVYRVPVRVPLDNIPDEIRQPRTIMLLLRWTTLEDTRDLILSNGRELYETPVTTYHDPRYQPEMLPHPADARFSERIELQSYDYLATIAAGETLPLSLRWNLRSALPADLTQAVSTVQLIDDQQTLIAQQDGLPYWYPLRFWLPGVPFTLDYSLPIPADTPPGDYTLRLGWYRRLDNEATVRLPLTQGTGRDDLYPLPMPVVIQTETTP